MENPIVASGKSEPHFASVMAMHEFKEKALAKTEPFYGRPFRSRPPDPLMAFLQSL
jgi:hypothetical protein